MLLLLSGVGVVCVRCCLRVLVRRCGSLCCMPLLAILIDRRDSLLFVIAVGIRCLTAVVC